LIASIFHSNPAALRVDGIPILLPNKNGAKVQRGKPKGKNKPQKIFGGDGF
jgi:hypothetical protein